MVEVVGPQSCLEAALLYPGLSRKPGQSSPGGRTHSTKLRHKSWKEKVVDMMASPGQGEAQKFVKGPACWTKACTTSTAKQHTLSEEAGNDNGESDDELEAADFLCDARGSLQDLVRIRERFASGILFGKWALMTVPLLPFFRRSRLAR